MRLRKMAAAVAVLAVTAAVAVWVVVPALAQTPTATPGVATEPPGHVREGRMGGGLGFGGGSVEEFDAEAQALGLTPTELFEQLHGGKDLSEIAEAQGVDLQTVRDALSTLRTQSMKDSIGQAVTDGRMSQEQADWLLEGIDKGYVNDLGQFGRLGGPMMGGGRLGGGPDAPKVGAERSQGAQS
jgi:hypothetical protein